LKQTLYTTYKDYMKTIAVTIDETTLDLLDELTASSPHHRNRSAFVRIAVREFAEREQKRKQEIQEHEVLHKHKKLLARQARELVAKQAALPS
jgi:Arc/MetJ-type ribon-helix-helix transcriptional regulator